MEKRFVEIFNKVNKVQLNESRFSNQAESDAYDDFHDYITNIFRTESLKLIESFYRRHDKIPTKFKLSDVEFVYDENKDYNDSLAYNGVVQDKNITIFLWFDFSKPHHSINNEFITTYLIPESVSNYDIEIDW